MTVRDKWLLGVTVLLTTLAIFLPDGGIFVLLNVIPVTLLVYLSYTSTLVRQLLKASPIIIVLMLISGGLLFALAAVIFWVMLVELILLLFPTALNIVATYFVIRFLPTTTARKLVLSVPISILLGLNLRLPVVYEVLSSHFNDNTVIQRQALLSPNEVLSVESDTKEWRLRPWVFDIATVRANALPNVWWHGPQIVTENMEQSLLNSQIPFRIRDNSSKTHLIIRSHEEGNHLIFNAAIVENGETIAYTQVKKRFRFLFEDVASGKRSLSDPYMRMSYLLYGNVWNVIFNYLDGIHSESSKLRLLQPFVEKAVAADKSAVTQLSYGLAELADPFSNVVPNEQTLCYFTFNDDRTLTFANGTKVTAHKLTAGLGPLIFETSDGVKKQISNTESFHLSRAICQNAGMVIIGSERGDNRLDNGIKVAWLNNHGVPIAETVIHLPNIDAEINRSLFGAERRGDCILLNISVQEGKYHKNGAAEEFLGYEACPLKSGKNVVNSNSG